MALRYHVATFQAGVAKTASIILFLQAMLIAFKLHAMDPLGRSDAPIQKYDS